MFEVKFPKSHNLDGKTHLIIIKDAEYVDGHIFVYGKTNDFPHLIIEIKYINEVGSWVMIPRTTKEIVEIFRQSQKKNVDLTEYIKKQLNGLQITNVEEIDYKFPHKEEMVPYFIDDSSEIISKYIEKKKNSNSDMVEDCEEIKNYLYRNYDTLPIDITQILLLNKRKAYNLIDLFLKENDDYHDIHREKEIIKLIEDIFNKLLEIPDSIYTEDNLIDLGCFLKKLCCQRVNNCDEESFDKLIQQGKKIMEELQSYTNHK